MSEKKEKQRLDIILVERGIYSGRDRAKAAIMAGEVMVDGKPALKAGENYDSDCQISIKEPLKYVSRGGLKLEKAIEVFNIDFKNKTVLDIGSSTGGFVDCALQNGATKVYAVDVGYGQLAWKLRNDEKVVVMEKTNARYINPESIKDIIDIVTVDASFISLVKVLACPLTFLKENGELAALIKPQFEAGREKIGKKGVVRDKNTHIEVINKVVFELRQLGMSVEQLDFSPITGPEGNIEYLLYAKKVEDKKIPFDIEKLVDIAWQAHAK